MLFDKQKTYMFYTHPCTILLSAVFILLLTGCGRVDHDNAFTKKITIADDDGATYAEKDKTGSKGSDGSERSDRSDSWEINDTEYIGRYDAVGLYLNDHYVRDEMFDGWYLELEDDGTGYMYFGEDDQGDISGWRMDGDSLTLKAGVLVFEGKSTIKDGILLLDFENDMIVAFCSPEVDRTSLGIISADEY